MRHCLLNGRILLDDGLVDGYAVLLADGRIEGVVSTGDPRCDEAERIDLGGDLLLPGFIDVQVNGGGGALFNDDPSVATIRRIGEAHRRFGTTGFLPTLISDDREAIAAAVSAASEAIDAGVPGVLGVHIEGPCLNLRRRGTHDPAKLRDLEDADIAILAALRGGRTLVTLAPEMTSSRTISRLREAGVIVCAGHTDASYAQMRQALADGVSGVTHLFNAMSPLASREPGVVGAALEDSDCWCGIIVDGQHVAPATLRVALAAKRHQRFLLVSDAMPSVGSSSNSFTLQGRRIEQVEGKLLDPDGVISGSALDMASAVRNACDLLGLSLPEAVRMASTQPAEFLGMQGETGSIRAGLRADLLQVDEGLQVRRSWIGGVQA
jgi:N-acetylglucosamine-6-phosphate deacetylase